MFMGEYNHTIDAKGRLIIPSKFRELLGEEFVLTRGLDGCLYIYPMDEWESFEMKLRSLPLTNKNARTFSRFFVAGATTCELDRQGRILVPQLKFGAKKNGMRSVIMMTWTALQRACRTWESQSDRSRLKYLAK